MDLREEFLLSGVFYLTLLPADFKADSLGPDNLTSKLAGLHADLRNIAIRLNRKNPRERYGGRFYLRVMAGRIMKNLSHTRFELFLQ